MIENLVLAAGLYLATGLLFALAFVTAGVQRLDGDARGGTIGFRILILPGAVLLWPLLAVRWARGAGVPAERTAHKRLAANAADERQGTTR